MSNPQAITFRELLYLRRSMKALLDPKAPAWKIRVAQDAYQKYQQQYAHRVHRTGKIRAPSLFSKLSNCYFCGLPWSTSHLRPYTNSSNAVCLSCCKKAAFIEDPISGDYGLPPDESYDARSCGYFPKTDKRLQYFGVELEIIHTGGDMSQAKYASAQKFFGPFAVVKADGTLGSIGVEVATAPATLEYHQAVWKSLANEEFRQTFDGWDRSCAGIHIHASKHLLSNLELGKIRNFMNRPGNTAFLVQIAGRNFPSNSWCGLQTNDINVGKLKELKNGKDPGRKYQPVNMHRHATIEFRIFQSTNQWARVLVDLEFVASLLDYCRVCSVKKLDYKSYVRWLTHRPHFKHLQAYLPTILDKDLNVLSERGPENVPNFS